MHQFYEKCAYFTAARYTRLIDKLATDVFKPTGMAPAYSYILLYLEDYSTASISDIANDLGYERTTVSRLIKKLSKKQLVKLQTQGRKTVVTLDTNSKTILEMANQCLAKLKKATDEILGDSKVDMTKLLTINYQKLERRKKID